MTVMAADTRAAHRRVTPGKSRADVWIVLILTGAASAALQMWHATHSGASTVPLIAGIVGLVPPAAAIGLSHVVATHKGAWWLRAVTVIVMLGVMAASASAAAAVVRAIDGPAFAWVLCLALDAAALACVWVLLADSERKAVEASAVQVAERTAREAQTAASEAAGRSAALEAELAETRAALEAVRTAAPAERSSRSVQGGPRPRKTAPADDLALEAKALELLAGDLTMSGAELARRLDVTPGYGRKLRRRLTNQDRQRDDPARVAEDRSEDRRS